MMVNQGGSETAENDGSKLVNVSVHRLVHRFWNVAKIQEFVKFPFFLKFGGIATQAIYAHVWGAPEWAHVATLPMKMAGASRDHAVIRPFLLALVRTCCRQ